MNWKKLFLKKPNHAVNAILSEWGREIYEAKGVRHIVDKMLLKYEIIENEISNLEYRKGYRLKNNWLKCCIAQTILSDSTKLFESRRWNYPDALKPVAKGAETVDHIDFSSALNGDFLIRIILNPISAFAAGSMVRNKVTGSVWEMSTQEDNGDYRLIGEDKNGRPMELVLKRWQMKNMEKI